MRLWEGGLHLACGDREPGRRPAVKRRLCRVAVALVAGLVGAGSAWANADGLAAEQSAAACAARDLPALFSAMTLSDSILRSYLAESVVFSDGETTQRIERAAYAGLPIGTLDYTYVTRGALEAWEADPAAPLTYVQVEFNQSQDDRWRVDWTELSGPILEGGDDDMQPVPVGRSGYLLFFPTATCWELVEDHIDAAS